jgi:hypothetical protein
LPLDGVKPEIGRPAISEVARSRSRRRGAGLSRWGGGVPGGRWATAGSWRGGAPRQSVRVVKEQRSAASRPPGAEVNWCWAGSRNPGSTRGR